MSTPQREYDVLVGRHRRITIPEDFGIKDGDKLTMQHTEHGIVVKLMTVQRGKVPVKLYATYIGSDKEGHAWGIIADANGNIGARVRSSGSSYIQKDLTVPKMDVEERLTKFFGNWEAPQYIIFKEAYKVSSEYAGRVLECREGLLQGTWPPRS